LIYIFISDECNWGCSHCNAKKNSKGELTEALKISQLFKLRTINYREETTKFVITGGEPSIYGYDYNKSIVDSIRALHKLPVHIEYFSNLSAEIQFYNELDVDSYIFSYHPTQISFKEYVEKFESVRANKSMRVMNSNRDQFDENSTNISWYDISESGDDYTARYTQIFRNSVGTIPNIYELNKFQLKMFHANI
jgi:organic radical activating enzyme